MNDNVIRPLFKFKDAKVESLIDELYEVIDKHATEKMVVVTLVGALDLIKYQILSRSEKP